MAGNTQFGQSCHGNPRYATCDVEIVIDFPTMNGQCWTPILEPARAFSVHELPLNKDKRLAMASNPGSKTPFGTALLEVKLSTGKAQAYPNTARASES
jgi:hypothetical protein